MDQGNNLHICIMQLLSYASSCCLCLHLAPLAVVVELHYSTRPIENTHWTHQLKHILDSISEKLPGGIMVPLTNAQPSW